MKKKFPNPERYNKYVHDKGYQKWMSKSELLATHELLWQGAGKPLLTMLDLPGFSNKVKVHVIMDLLDDAQDVGQFEASGPFVCDCVEQVFTDIHHPASNKPTQIGIIDSQVISEARQYFIDRTRTSKLKALNNLVRDKIYEKYSHLGYSARGDKFCLSLTGVANLGSVHEFGPYALLGSYALHYAIKASAEADILHGMPAYARQLDLLRKCLGDPSTSKPKPQPKTNTDNDICHFCGGPTQPLFVFGAMYCPKCKK